jgi:16S rRNA (cytosine967-C5)-methyltransferase
LDIHSWKLNELQKRATRAGVDIIEARPIDDSKVVKRLYEQADKLLLDVPCSGSGVLKRNPDSKWKFKMSSFQSLLRTQSEILKDYSEMVKEGGEMIYSTCSIFPSENQGQIEGFLNSESGKKWSLVSEQVLPPQHESQDGFYMAKLQKAEPSR